MAEKKCTRCTTKEHEHSLSWDLLKELTKTATYWKIIAITTAFLWIATIALFVGYINQLP